MIGQVKKRKFGYWLLGLYLIAWALRVGILLLHPNEQIYWHTDSELFWNHAEAMVERGELPFPYAPWGYSIILIIPYWMGLSPLLTTLTLHTALSALLVPVVGWACLPAGRRAALFAAVVCLLHPMFLNLSIQLIADSIFLIPFAASFGFLFRQGMHSALCAGLMVGLACCFRSTGLPLLAAIPVMMLLFMRWKKCGYFLAGALPVVLIFSACGWALTGRAFFISEQSTKLYDWKPVIGGYVSTTPEERAERGSYLEFAMRDPLAFLWERGMSFTTYLSPWPLDAHRPIWKKAPPAIFDIFIYLGTFWVILLWLRGRIRPGMFHWCLLFFVLMLMFHTLIFSQPRYRAPAMLALICYVCVGFGGRTDRLQNRRYASDRSLSADKNPASAAVVITTKNRVDDLEKAVRSALAQEGRVEVLVMDDSSDDETVSRMRNSYPEVKLQEHEESCGYIVRRNQAASLTDADVIISIDDDATLDSPHVVKQTLAAFDNPRVGAVAIPVRHVLDGNKLDQCAPDEQHIWICDDFMGTAHALRRELFIALGAYRESLVHQGEERDYAIRLLDAGYFVRMGSGDTISHHESPRRSFARMDYYGRRNDVIFAWCNVPSRYLLPHLAATCLKGLAFSLRVGRPLKMYAGMMDGLRECLLGWHERSPVSPGTYRKFRALRTPERLD